MAKILSDLAHLRRIQAGIGERDVALTFMRVRPMRSADFNKQLREDLERTARWYLEGEFNV